MLPLLVWFGWQIWPKSSIPSRISTHCNGKKTVYSDFVLIEFIFYSDTKFRGNTSSFFLPRFVSLLPRSYFCCYKLLFIATNYVFVAIWCVAVFLFSRIPICCYPDLYSCGGTLDFYCKRYLLLFATHFFHVIYFVSCQHFYFCCNGTFSFKHILVLMTTTTI